jgi:Uma2 family endonuclease
MELIQVAKRLNGASEREAIESRCEYIHGEIFAMTGATEAHNVLATNISGELHRQMKGAPCRVYASDMKVRIRSANAGTYPDIVALCGEREFLDDRRDILLNPTFIAEVLSPSTEAFDRGGKFAIYRQIPSLREYLLVSQSRIQAELYTRGPDHRWTLTDYTRPEDLIVLESLGCSLRLADLYDKVDLATL